jgi:long-chain acyl-CoA synthetase
MIDRAGESPRGPAGIPVPRVAAVLQRVLDEEPGRTALVAPDRTLTYAELDDEAARAAGALIALGLRPGDRIAVSLPNDSRIVSLFHAVMRIGGVWVGVGRALAAAEQQEILRHCGARFAIGCLGGSRHLSESVWQEALEAARPARGLPDVDPHAPAAIAYTSGTTGRPKGAVHSQHNLLVPGAVLSATRGYDHALRKADSLPMTILNLLVLSTLLTSQAGGTAVISDIRDARRIVAWLRDTGATVWNGVPPMLYDLAHDDAIGNDALDGLAEVWSGGDSLSEDIRAAVAGKFGRRIIGTYGLTEAPTVVAIEDPGAGHVPGGSGTVLPHLEVSTRPIRDGAVPADDGELCVTAAATGPYAGLYTPMLGYWQDPPATAKALRDGALRTGDLGHVDGTGQVFIAGRRSLVIVRGGANVYPAEIERVIGSCAGVVAAAVLGVPDDRLGARVAAVVQVRSGATEWPGRLREHCLGALARYKVPERWQITADPLPRNAMGKIDRPRLAAGFTPSAAGPRSASS